MRKKIFLSLLTVLMLAVVWQHELLWYGIKQGQGQLAIVRNAVDLKRVMGDERFPDSLKSKIQIIQRARTYAVEELGLKDTENYTTYYEQNGETALWNVSACKPYSFTPKTWWFPVVGEVPYKGFFDREKAESVADELKEDGWEVRVRPVGGWSTLGWFRDPILSSMLNRSEGQLAELIIHELTHGAVFVKDEVTFNENLASFIGEQGARLFLEENFGAESNELAAYLNGEQDAKKFTNHILLGTKKLDSLYESFDQKMDAKNKRIKKEELILNICDRLDTLSFSNDRYTQVFSETKPNNAYFMSYLRYYSAGDSLTTIWEEQYDGDLKLFIEGFMAEYGS